MTDARTDTETSTATGRAIRVLVAKPGLDGHDVGARLVVHALEEAGFDTVYSGLRQSSEEIADAAESHSVDVIGLSIMSGAHLPVCTRFREEIDRRDLGSTLWIVGGVIPEGDVAALKELGVDGVFPVGTPFNDIVSFIREKVQR